MLRIRHGVNDYVSQIIYVDMENMAKILLMSCIDRSSHFPIAYIQHYSSTGHCLTITHVKLNVWWLVAVGGNQV